ncbi:lysophospholipase L1-like esterase [Catalinimonas alkaloidigena]|uniref:SGNH/GDSL hydrolase family protein n=1 Tax=Catalinimonas alkaloidigena TaxID=1075417 RepID=UPI002406881E|nr:SGNH/GDSL hydrolase family protein [Catalinimonas alkaloidigena]MDF9795165.1 lysophospholipase L1-like esterase [Catalinimonas alkaloidigena]
MKKLYRVYVSLLSLSLFFSACETEDELIEERLENNPLPPVGAISGDPGTVNLGKFVAIGNSLTAGLMDAALYSSGQQNSFPNILANHFQAVEGLDAGTFNQPDISSTNGYNISINNVGGQVAGRFILDTSIPGPIPTVGELPTPYGGDRSQLNNFGVPGARVLDVAASGYGQVNPFFARFASSANASMLGDASAAQGSFFTVWLGGNDVLSWARVGGAAPDGEENPDAEQTEANTLSSINSFTQAYSNVINSMLAAHTDARGVAITIPSITLLPFFRAVTYDPIALDQANADALNAGYADYNQGVQAAAQFGMITEEEAALRNISFQLTTNANETNAVVILDEDLSDITLPDPQGGDPIVLPKLRQANASDLLTFNVATLLGTSTEAGIYGLEAPVENQYVLTLNEQIVLNTRIAFFNGIIAQIVASTGGRVALVDVNTIFADVAGLTAEQATQLGLSSEAIASADGVQGIVVDGVSLQPDFSPNGIISTDGVHPNPKGHALVANAIIEVMNEAFEADIPPIDITPFRTVVVAL